MRAPETARCHEASLRLSDHGLLPFGLLAVALRVTLRAGMPMGRPVGILPALRRVGVLKAQCPHVSMSV